MDNNSVADDGWIHVESRKRNNKHRNNCSRYVCVNRNNKCDDYIEEMYANDKCIQNRKNNNDNYKKILCKNINCYGNCVYNNKCLYAHSLDEQHVEPVRSIVYNMIKKNNDLSNIDLSKSRQIYNALLSLTRVCQRCAEHNCTGGYNCKHGACDSAYVICHTDLNKGTCNGSCGKIHLTKKGLVPYGISVMKNLKTKVSIPKPRILNDDFFMTGHDKSDQSDECNKKTKTCTNDLLFPNLNSDDDRSICDLSCNKESKLAKSIFAPLNV